MKTNDNACLHCKTEQKRFFKCFLNGEKCSSCEESQDLIVWARVEVFKTENCFNSKLAFEQHSVLKYFFIKKRHFSHSFAFVNILCNDFKTDVLRYPRVVFTYNLRTYILNYHWITYNT